MSDITVVIQTPPPIEVGIVDTPINVTITPPPAINLTLAQGPKGDPGSGSGTGGEPNGERAYDRVSSSIAYAGYAAFGSATSDPAWKIKKIIKGSPTTVLFADGNENYDNVWDNRASLSYS